ncbi:transmembrane protein 80 [Mantella aurantiaca]
MAPGPIVHTRAPRPAAHACSEVIEKIDTNLTACQFALNKDGCLELISSGGSRRLIGGNSREYPTPAGIWRCPGEILLYVNVAYYVFYFLATLLMIIYKSQVFSYPDSNLALDLGLLFLMAISESVRLYLGTMGNLTEEGLPLGSSLFLTIGNVFLSVYFLVWETYILRADLIINGILLVLYGLEAILEIFTVATFFR